ncbi:uncharacterized protein Z518_01485 [Rhinocladiella mackenziei CBS 650.93]|uniref:Roadblock/LAMTOR2 domain-containing protein n=1 Tax=Rhinocladiella mackenziei CBS 650.93 TaxID=1442369 RepID=A0A0D2HI96_9EURO|nr:uncharacterized protein Z518_01485 [Rhinocladiella mackenziei CBS 650.93]KIX10403.1 hypothetical protein Z518_01485 [Rhinocladiella mackenziei CBS 650.93]
MLRGLTDRPNVQSTLILSRKDGSIVRATGIVVSGRPGTTGAGTSYPWPRAQGEGQKPDGNQEGDAVLEGQDQDGGVTQLKAVELLASSIFQFVTNASMLGFTLGSTSRSASGPDGSSSYGDPTTFSKQEPNAEEESDQKVGEDEIQLLRLRTRHQEIIIFPDPNYICCVVQRVGKAGNIPDRR